MGNSPLDFINSEGFRKKLIVRNLTPYAKAPNRPTPPFNTEYVQSDTSVQDSPDQLIDTPSFANNLYPLNQYGNEGGYEQVPDPNGLNNTKSNEGEYGYQDANIVDQAVPESQKWKPLNVYSNGSQLQLDSAPFFNSLDRPQTTNLSNNQPYPTTFVPSSYTPVSILLYQATFTATLINNEYTEIIWRTSVENNFASLLLERSADSYTYEPLGELKESTPKGSSIEFALNDTKPLPGLNYYRVKQTDKSGKTSYSSVSYVNFMQSLESVGNTKQNNN